MVSGVRRGSEEEAEVEDPTKDQEEQEVKEHEEQEVKEQEPVRSSRRKCKYKLKQGLPLPPRPVLALSQSEVHTWFPVLVERLTGPLGGWGLWVGCLFV